MPCDYSKYPTNWKTEIRPAILERDGHACKFCKVPNRILVCRGFWKGKEVWQNDDGQIYDASNGEYYGDSYVGDVWIGEKYRLTEIILTIAHLDRDNSNNEPENLAALCQRCHLNHDKDQHRANSRKTNEAKKGLQNLF